MMLATSPSLAGAPKPHSAPPAASVLFHCILSQLSLAQPESEFFSMHFKHVANVHGAVCIAAYETVTVGC